MSETKHIKNGWDVYRAIVIPENASQQQMEDMKHAFFSGAAFIVQLLLRLQEPGLETEIGSIHKEATEFSAYSRKKLLKIQPH